MRNHNRSNEIIWEKTSNGQTATAARPYPITKSLLRLGVGQKLMLDVDRVKCVIDETGISFSHTFSLLLMQHPKTNTDRLTAPKLVQRAHFFQILSCQFDDLPCKHAIRFCTIDMTPLKHASTNFYEPDSHFITTSFLPRAHDLYVSELVDRFQGLLRSGYSILPCAGYKNPSWSNLAVRVANNPKLTTLNLKLSLNEQTSPEIEALVAEVHPKLVALSQIQGHDVKENSFRIRYYRSAKELL